MSDKPEKPKWELVNRALEKKKLDRELPPAATPAAVPGGLATPPQALGEPQGIIAKFQAGKVKRQAVVEHLRTWYAANLDVTKHQLSEAVRVRKAESTMVAEQFLRNLDQQHLEYLTSLGLRNLETRQRALIEVADQTTKTLKDMKDKDWPPQLIDKTIQGIFELHERFFAKTMEELGKDKSSN